MREKELSEEEIDDLFKSDDPGFQFNSEEEFKDWLDRVDIEWKRKVRVKERTQKLQKIKSKM